MPDIFIGDLPAASAVAGGDELVANQGGTARTVTAAQLRAYVGAGAGETYAADYAVGDGTTDDTLALRAAITAAGEGGVLVFAAGATYLLSGSLTPLAGQTWVGYGATLKRRNQLSTTTATAIGTGSEPTVITVASAAGLAVGMDLTVYSGGSFDDQNHRITAIASTSVTLATTFSVAFPSGGTVITSFPLIDNNRYGKADGVTILGLSFDGNAANNTSLRKWELHQELYFGSDGGRLRGLRVSNAQSEGILIYGDDVLVEGCVVTQCEGNGVHLGAACNDVRILGNWIAGTNLSGTAPGHADGCIAISDDIHDTIISGNHLEGGLAAVGGVSGSDNSRLLISGNTCIGCTDAIVMEVNSGDHVEDVVISGNRFNACGEVRLSLAGSASATNGPRKLTFIGNTFVDTRLVLTNVVDSAITNNALFLASTTEDAIEVLNCNDVVITGNTIVGGRYGVSIGNGSNRAIAIRGNALKNQYRRSIYAWDAVLGAVEVSGNTIVLENGFTYSGSGWTGVDASGADGLIIRDNTIDVQPNASNIICIVGAVGGASSPGARIVGNLCQLGGSSGATVYLDTGSQKNVVMHNLLSKAPSDSGSGNVLVGNYNSLSGAAW